ncbi:hypothetical protein KV100_03110 [Mumia sp. zg.B21]|uniref:hypothetical protein n=1 Tax=Mumia sp. zg.B21 TaxID=2855447 RepID=UPI001C6E064A|nr:hypothetical protein [Mumia sp. zg.B21]MBW9208630.1 hypothetical protein [Mumia sp. zg.B21]
MTEQGLLFSLEDDDATAVLARELKLPRDEFIELFGNEWAEHEATFQDCDDAPSGDLENRFDPWYVAGKPIQLMLRVNGDLIDLAVPRPRWFGHRLEVMPERRETIRRRGWDPELVADVVKNLLRRRRSSFRYCRYCFGLTPPEHLFKRDTCMGCASDVLHVRF